MTLKTKIKMYVSYFQNMGVSAIKVFFLIFILKFIKVKNNKYKIRIKNKKTGSDNLVVRPFTTDLILIERLLVYNGEYDFLYADFLEYSKKSKVIIDAGANIGIFSRIINQINKEALIIAIEPEKENFSIMQENLFFANIVLKQNGLWNKKCGLKVIPSKKGEWGFTVRECKKNERSDVFGISILDIMKEYNLDNIDILKMDIEGSEYEVFEDSAKHWLDKVGMLIIEFHDKKKQWCSLRVMEKMKSFNFDYRVYNEYYVFFKNDI